MSRLLSLGLRPAALAGLFAALLLTAAPAGAQGTPPSRPSDEALSGIERDRPVPYPVQPPPAFRQAIQRGTRTASGAPGPNYWTNKTAYDIEATLAPERATLSGSETVRYQNNSPDTLRNLVLHLRQNLHKEGAVRNREVQITGGVTLSRVAYDGRTLQDSDDARAPGYTVAGTRLIVRLPQPLAPGARSAPLAVEWSFEIPEAGAPRMGQDGEVFYLGYWYPQIAVYDDLHGWTAEAYQGNGEFYMDYADYDVAITVPEDFLVQSTGTLENPQEVLTAQTRRRLDEARTADSVVSVVGADERGAGAATTPSEDGTHTWRFSADEVRDVAFGTSDRYVWDATHAETGDDEDGTAMIHAVYRPDKQFWKRSAEYARFSIEHLSDMLIPYPYAHMTTVEGLIGGGMEYPMMTLIGGAGTAEGLFGVTYHELSHMWFPMVVGSNEKQFTWMDEGTTTFNTTEGEGDFYDRDAWAEAGQRYRQFAGSGLLVESMRPADDYPTEPSPGAMVSTRSPGLVQQTIRGALSRVIASYGKPGLMLHALEGVLGKETFSEAYREYARRWAYKHPTPYDFFNTFEDVADRDLDWFWRPAFYENWTLDQAVASVDEEAGTITIEDQGLMPMPVPLEITYADGDTEMRTVPVDRWLSGARTATVEVDGGYIERVEIDPQHAFPDTDRTDNTWTDGAASR